MLNLKHMCHSVLFTFVDSVSSSTKVTQRPWLIVKKNFNDILAIYWLINRLFLHT